MSGDLRVGLVGASAGGSWGTMAHIPAIEAADGVVLGAVCTRRPESAAASSAAFGVPGFHDVRAMVREVDVVSVVVKVPGHRDAVVAALEAGKPVYCEWPLGLDTAEAEEMAGRVHGIAAVGFQGRHAPELATMKAMIADGFVGDVLSVDMRWLTSRGAAPPPGASMFAVGGGHTLDCVLHVVGPLAWASAEMDAERGAEPVAIGDVLIHGGLENGGLLSYRMGSLPNHGTGWTLEVHGSEGMLVATTNLMPQITPITLRGARGKDPIADIPAAERFVAVPGVSFGPPRNIAESYARMARAIRAGDRFRADFEDAVAMHRLLDQIRDRAGTGRFTPGR